ESAAATFDRCFCQVSAAAAVHPTAFIFTAHDLQRNPLTVWPSIEYPALTQNPKVKEIYRVDPRPVEHGGGKIELLWSRYRKDDELEITDTCPV
ncbi:uncharacterized protein HMPREF1541_02190, partial [Cyphellophora europaea CBS 101466]